MLQTYTVTYTKANAPGHTPTDVLADSIQAAEAEVKARDWWGAEYRVVGVESADGVNRQMDHTYWWG